MAQKGGGHSTFPLFETATQYDYWRGNLALSLALFQLGGFAGGMLAARTMGVALPAVGIKHAFFGLLGGIFGYIEGVASTEY